MTITVSGATVVGSDQPTTVSFEDGVITGIGDEVAAGRLIPAEGLHAAPGLIDLQINGGYGHDFTSDPASIWSVGERLPEHGITAFLPTVISAPEDVIESALSVLSRRPDGYRGAEPLGLHAEGPMLSSARPGVHDTSHLRTPSSDVVRGWSRDRGLAMVTIAPELAGALPVVERLVDGGVVVSAGHSDADYDTASAGFRAGISAVTHLFNAMPPLHHRQPGLVGAALDAPGVVIGLIVDGVHVHPSLVSAVWRVVGPGRLALVSDGMAATGMGPGRYRIGSVSVEVAEGRCHDERGRLAGSTLTLDQAVRNMIEFSGCSPAAAVEAASSVPARLLGLGDRGRLSSGALADVTLFDTEMRVRATIIRGELVFER